MVDFSFINLRGNELYWLKGSSRMTTPTILAYTIGQVMDFHLTLVTETGEELTDAYLFVGDPAYAGLVQAKLSAETEYKEIRQAFDASCFLGHVAAETQVDIDFRVWFPEGASDGYRIIAVLVGHDDGAEPSVDGLWSAVWQMLWHDEWPVLESDDW